MNPIRSPSGSPSNSDLSPFFSAELAAKEYRTFDIIIDQRGSVLGFEYQVVLEPGLVVHDNLPLYSLSLNKFFLPRPDVCISLPDSFN